MSCHCLLNRTSLNLSIRQVHISLEMVNIMPNQAYQQWLVDDGVEDSTDNDVFVEISAGWLILQLLLTVEHFLFLICQCRCLPAISLILFLFLSISPLRLMLPVCLWGPYPELMLGWAVYLEWMQLAGLEFKNLYRLLTLYAHLAQWVLKLYSQFVKFPAVT